MSSIDKHKSDSEQTATTGTKSSDATDTSDELEKNEPVSAKRAWSGQYASSSDDDAKTEQNESLIDSIQIQDKTEIELAPEPEGTGSEIDTASSSAEEDDDRTIIMPPSPSPRFSQTTTGSQKATKNSSSGNSQVKKTKIGMTPSNRQRAKDKSFSQTQTNAKRTIKIGSGMLLKGRFDLFEKLGEGGMGVVYKALDRRDVEAGNTTFIAIKVLNDEFRSNPDVLKALHSEARKTQQLAHPNIITVYDFDRDDDAVFMTMEYMNGATLDYMIKTNPVGLKVKDALHIIDQLGNALSYAHSNLVIHSDFKPGNIFIDRANHVKILDFGIARLSSLTQANRFDAGVLGALTPAYASLEMLQGEVPDPRDDIYAFACVIYELLTGKHPFNRNDARRAKYNNQKPKEIKSLNRKQWKALKKALAFDRNQRTKTVEELINGLHSGNDTWFYALGGLVVVVLLVMLSDYMPWASNETRQSSSSQRGDAQSAGGAGSQIDLENQQKTIVEKPIYKVPLPPKTTPQNTNVDTQTIAPSLPEPEVINLGKISISTLKSRYKIGDNLNVMFSVDKPMYVRVALIDSNGEVTQLFPNPYQEDNFCQPGVKYYIPPQGSDLELTIFGPAGLDKIRAVAMLKQFSPEVMKFSKDGKLISGISERLLFGKTEYRILE